MTEIKITVVHTISTEVINLFKSFLTGTGIPVADVPAPSPNGLHKVGAPAAVSPKEEFADGKNDNTITLAKLSAAVVAKSKVEDNRGKIKAKLTELGAANVKTLAEEHFTILYNFVENL